MFQVIYIYICFKSFLAKNGFFTSPKNQEKGKNKNSHREGSRRKSWLSGLAMQHSSLS